MSELKDLRNAKMRFVFCLDKGLTANRDGKTRGEAGGGGGWGRQLDSRSSLWIGPSETPKWRPSGRQLDTHTGT